MAAAETRGLLRDAIWRRSLGEFDALCQQHSLSRSDIRNHMLACIKHGSYDIFKYLSERIVLNTKDVIRMLRYIKYMSMGCITTDRFIILMILRTKYEIDPAVMEKCKGVGWDNFHLVPAAYWS